eukprot:jgi/Tetstr1/449239/TSEL_036444.t1
MAKELRKSRGEELFAVAVREVFDAVAELRTDQSTEWTEELKESLMEFADIIAEPTDLPPEREFDFEINLESDEPPKERTVSDADKAPLSREDHETYRAILGSVNFLTMCTRPDLAFAISVLSRFQSAPQKIHLMQLKRVLRYLKGTPGMGITYGATEPGGGSPRSLLRLRLGR